MIWIDYERESDEIDEILKKSQAGLRAAESRKMENKENCCLCGGKKYVRVKVTLCKSCFDRIRSGEKQPYDLTNTEAENKFYGL